MSEMEQDDLEAVTRTKPNVLQDRRGVSLKFLRKFTEDLLQNKVAPEVEIYAFQDDQKIGTEYLLPKGSSIKVENGAVCRFPECSLADIPNRPGSKPRKLWTVEEVFAFVGFTGAQVEWGESFEGSYVWTPKDTCFAELVEALDAHFDQSCEAETFVWLDSFAMDKSCSLTEVEIDGSHSPPELLYGFKHHLLYVKSWSDSNILDKIVRNIQKFRVENIPFEMITSKSERELQDKELLAHTDIVEKFNKIEVGRLNLRDGPTEETPKLSSFLVSLFLSWCDRAKCNPEGSKRLRDKDIDSREIEAPSKKICSDNSSSITSIENAVLKAEAHLKDGNFKGAEEVYQQFILKVASKRGSRVSDEVANAMEQIAKIFLLQKRFIESLEMFDSALAMYSTISNCEDQRHRGIVSTTHGLALAQQYLGNIHSALETIQEVIRRKKVIFGPMSIEVAQALQDMASMHLDAGEPGQAKVIYNEALVMATGHNEVIATIFEGLSTLAFTKKEYGIALGHLNNALSAARRCQRTKANLKVPFYLLRSSRFLVALKDEKEALANFKEAFEFLTLLEPNYVQSMSVLEEFILLIEECEPHTTAALLEKFESLGLDTWKLGDKERIHLFRSVGLICKRKGGVATSKAKILMERALSLSVIRNGLFHPETVAIRIQLDDLSESTFSRPRWLDSEQRARQNPFRERDRAARERAPRRSWRRIVANFKEGRMQPIQLIGDGENAEQDNVRELRSAHRKMSLETFTLTREVRLRNRAGVEGPHERRAEGAPKLTGEGDLAARLLQPRAHVQTERADNREVPLQDKLNEWLLTLNAWRRELNVCIQALIDLETQTPNGQVPDLTNLRELDLASQRIMLDTVPREGRERNVPNFLDRFQRRSGDGFEEWNVNHQLERTVWQTRFEQYKVERKKRLLENKGQDAEAVPIDGKIDSEDVDPLQKPVDEHLPLTTSNSTDTGCIEKLLQYIEEVSRASERSVSDIASLAKLVAIERSRLIALADEVQLESGEWRKKIQMDCDIQDPLVALFKQPIFLVGVQASDFPCEKDELETVSFSNKEDLDQTIQRTSVFLGSGAIDRLVPFEALFVDRENCQLCAYSLLNKFTSLSTMMSSWRWSRRSVSLCKQILCDVIEGVEQIHRLGLVHSNLTADCIFITEKNRALIGGYFSSHLRREGQCASKSQTDDFIAVGKITCDLFALQSETAETLITMLQKDASALRIFTKYQHSPPEKSNSPRECLRCLEPIVSDFICCNHSSGGHFLCKTCGDDWILGGININSVMKDGSLECCMGMECQVSSRSIPTVLSLESWNLILRNWSDQRVILNQNEIALRRSKQKPKDEGNRVYFYTRNIVEEILTLRCPNCRLAFIDFKGCFALTCANDSFRGFGCREKFCAWCLKQFPSGSGYSHLRNCEVGKIVSQKINSSSTFGSKESFEVAMCHLRTERLLGYWSEHISSESESLRDGLIDNLVPFFDRLDVTKLDSIFFF